MFLALMMEILSLSVELDVQDRLALYLLRSNTT